jgi:hypothetical protein
MDSDGDRPGAYEGSHGGCIMISLTRYKAGEAIVQENEFGETAYVILEGQVEVTKKVDEQEVHLAYLGLKKPLAK